MDTNCNLPMVDNEQKFLEIIKAKDRLMVLIYASWCPFCIRFLAVFKKISREIMGNCLIVKDNQAIIADKYAVNVVPTVLFFENGVVLKRLDGRLGVGLSEKQLMDFIDKCNLPKG